MNNLEVIKRDGRKTPFNKSKIEVAIMKAMNSSSGIYEEGLAEKIATEIEEFARVIHTPITIHAIEEQVYYKLTKYGNVATAKAYESYRSVQEYKRQINTIDNDVVGILNRSNLNVLDENSNKDAKIVSTQRDLIAGEVSKDVARRILMPTDIVMAHDSGAIHFHDMDYIIQPMFNCCLINLEDMLKNGTCINGKKIDTPKSFQVACTVTTQIIAQVASGQYGGQSINGVDRILAPYVRKSFDKYYKDAIDDQVNFYGIEPNEEMAREVAWKRTKKEVRDGIQTMQYQINTLMTTNGQAPFVTLFMYFKPGYEYEKEAALITEEILKQRYEGIKNSQDVYVTPAFPKLIYVLDEHNIHEDSKYYYLTKLAAKCTAKRMYPDYISAKKMRELYQGNVFSPMGCRSFLAPWKNEDGEYVFDGRFNMGVVSLNLPQIGILSGKDEEKYFEILEKRLELAKKALLFRYQLLKDITSDVSPIHWQYGAIARLEPHEKVTKLLQNGYATISLGYIGLYEASILVTGESHTKGGKEFALKVIKRLHKAVDDWKKETGLGFALYGTPAESLTNRFAQIDLARFGSIKDVTDKGYYTNSYHVDVREHISVFDKFKFESEFQKESTGGMISYAEIPNMSNNVEALETMIKFIYDNICYAEFNTKSDYCHVCGFDGEIVVNDDNEWECPQCHNKDKSKLTVIRRTCGYLGENFWNEGRTKEIKSRVLHI
ncbi:MAG: anaerobic ribonucleoside-triphosphate reductase [Ezakiella sp.]|nr:anaerobic ribonucleoside-triphosphate reductase [Ezakiella sp.]MDD7471662.1 anaerobic ribonucleoside-triphosphate reductase [Bacillota bacterium]MDY3923446.1 anaerobic ribonucleoside-triphosphate reductase [Ezakiella sp.]